MVAAVLVAAVILVGLIKRTATGERLRIDRVQNVNTKRSLRQRILRVGTVDFDTAASGDYDVRFIGIDNPGRVAAAVDKAQRDAATRSDPVPDGL